MPFTLLSAGSNAHGQLGHSLNEDSSIFLPCSFDGLPNGTLPNGAKILDIAAGANHTIALLEVFTSNPGETRREVWGCGDGGAGQLGSWPASQLGTSSSSASRADIFRRLILPLDDEGLQEYQCKFIAAGWETTYLVLSPPLLSESNIQGRSDVVLSMGADDLGDLGVGGKTPAKLAGNRKAKPLNRIAFDHILLGGVPLSTCDAFTVETIAAKQHHVLVHLRVGSTARGLIVGWGAARHGQISPLLSTASSTTQSAKPSAVIDCPQLVYEEDRDDAYVSCSVGAQHSLFLKASGKVVGLGSNKKGQLEVELWKDVRAVGCSWNSTFSVLPGSLVRAAGSNSHGQLGNTTAENTVDSCQVAFPDALLCIGLSKLACGSEHVLTLWGSSGGSNPEVWGWGWNEHGNLGIGTNEDARTPVKVYPLPRNSDVVDIWAGSGTSWLCCETLDNE